MTKAPWLIDLAMKNKMRFAQDADSLVAATKFGAIPGYFIARNGACAAEDTGEGAK